MSPSKKAKTSQDPTIEAKAVTAPTVVQSPEREEMVAKAAYFRAEGRDFRGGDPQQDWLEAEAEIDSNLSNVYSG